MELTQSEKRLKLVEQYKKELRQKEMLAIYSSDYVCDAEDCTWTPREEFNFIDADDRRRIGRVL